MKYSFEPLLDISRAILYFDRPISDDFASADYDVGHLHDQAMPALVRSMLGIPGVWGVKILENAIAIERVSFDFPWFNIQKNIALLVAHDNGRVWEPEQIEPQEIVNYGLDVLDPKPPTE